MFKRGVVFGILFGFILLASVGAQQVCSDPTQKIFSISNGTNAHGELWNQGNYAYEICYDNYFKNTYNGDKHTCSPGDDNKLFRISSATNAHAQQYSIGTYPETVCFGDLSCVARSAAEGCLDNEASIVSLSGSDNAHLELTGQENYPVVICCQSDSNDPICNYNGICEPGLGENADNCADCRTAPRVWINEPKAIPYAENSVPNLNFTSRGASSCDWFLDDALQNNIASCTDGEHLVDLSGSQAQQIGNHNITVYGKDSGDQIITYDEVLFNVQEGVSGDVGAVEWQNGIGERIIEVNVNTTVYLNAQTTFGQGQRVDFEIRENDPIGDDFVASVSATTDANGVAEYSWFIDDGIFDRWADGLNGNAEFYFNASAPGTSNVSEDLDVLPGEGPNTPPRANITSPIHRQVYYINTEVEFNHSSFDAEGNIVSFLWTIVDANGDVELETEEESFVYNFTYAGQKTITLRVEDSKGASDEDQIAILAIASPGILAYIEKPGHHQILPEWNGNRRLIINYSGKDSYAINAEGNCPDVNITCLAGNCPNQTMNYPFGCNEIIPVKDTPQPFDLLNFTWIFSDGQVFSGSGSADGDKAWGRRSQNLNDKSIILELLYNDGPINIGADTDREFTLGQCVGGEAFYEIDSNGEVVRELDTFSDPGACKGEDQLNGTKDDCCTANFACLSDDNGIFLCRSPLDSPEFCSDYQEEGVCDEDPYSVAENEPGWDDECEEGWSNNRSQPVECGCKWSNQDDVCKFDKSYIDGGDDEGEICIEYECLESYERGECNNGYMELTIFRELVQGECYIGENNCVPPEERVTVPCGRPTIELPFFEKEQFIGALIVIALIYLIVRYVRKEE